MDPTMVTIVINGICLIACLICNAATFAKIGCIKRTIQGTNTNSGTNQVELNLIIITVMLSAILSTSLIFQVKNINKFYIKFKKYFLVNFLLVERWQFIVQSSRWKREQRLLPSLQPAPLGQRFARPEPTLVVVGGQRENSE